MSTTSDVDVLKDQIKSLKGQIKDQGTLDAKVRTLDAKVRTLTDDAVKVSESNHDSLKLSFDTHIQNMRRAQDREDTLRIQLEGALTKVKDLQEQIFRGTDEHSRTNTRVVTDVFKNIMIDIIHLKKVNDTFGSEIIQMVKVIRDLTNECNTHRSPEIHLPHNHLINHYKPAPKLDYIEDDQTVIDFINHYMIVHKVTQETRDYFRLIVQTITPMSIFVDTSHQYQY